MRNGLTLCLLILFGAVLLLAAGPQGAWAAESGGRSEEEPATESMTLALGALFRTLVPQSCIDFCAATYPGRDRTAKGNRQHCEWVCNQCPSDVCLVDAPDPSKPQVTRCGCEFQGCPLLGEKCCGLTEEPCPPDRCMPLGCCPVDTTPCGTECCAPNQRCENGTCVDQCTTGGVICGQGCCLPGWPCASSGPEKPALCCSPGSTFCPNPATIHGGQCFPPGWTCCPRPESPGHACPAGTTCCNGACIGPDEICCGFTQAALGRIVFFAVSNEFTCCDPQIERQFACPPGFYCCGPGLPEPVNGIECQPLQCIPE
jgi:hypothetical protein